MPILVTNDSFLIYHRKKCHELINTGFNNKEDIMQFFLALHIVLEVGINSFFRQLVTVRKFGGLNMSCLDQVNFIDKVTMFFYLPYSSNDISPDVIDKNRKAIGILKNFTEVRNKLMHGHVNAEIFESCEDCFIGKIKKRTVIAKLINNEKVITQINDFKFIINSFIFFVDAYWDSFGITETEEEKEIIDVKAGLVKLYLDKSFLDV